VTFSQKFPAAVICNIYCEQHFALFWHCLQLCSTVCYCKCLPNFWFVFDNSQI